MLKALPLYTKEREKSDMADLEVLGSISFDLHINKNEEIKNAFVSLVAKLGTMEFLEEYCALYNKIMQIYKGRGASLYHEGLPEFAFESETTKEKPSEMPIDQLLDSCVLLQEISISTGYINKD
ncbi:hypothetical protein NEAUS03_0903 [Nematocida ausubeli]|nr:hypothetical protein NEAUS03_0903 [Nematocida ausubeli]